MAFSKLNFGILQPGGNSNSDYKRGYDDCEKKYKKLQQQYDVIQRQLRRLGYEVGEEPNVLKNASEIAKHCKTNVNCDKCVFHISKSDTCSLAGENPSSWRVS